MNTLFTLAVRASPQLDCLCLWWMKIASFVVTFERPSLFQNVILSNDCSILCIWMYKSIESCLIWWNIQYILYIEFATYFWSRFDLYPLKISTLERLTRENLPKSSNIKLNAFPQTVICQCKKRNIDCIIV